MARGFSKTLRTMGGGKVRLTVNADGEIDLQVWSGPDYATVELSLTNVYDLGAACEHAEYRAEDALARKRSSTT